MELGKAKLLRTGLNALHQAVHPVHGIAWTDGKQVCLTSIFYGGGSGSSEVKFGDTNVIGQFEHVFGLSWSRSSSSCSSPALLAVQHKKHVTVWQLQLSALEQDKLLCTQTCEMSETSPLLPQGCVWHPRTDALAVLTKRDASVLLSARTDNRRVKTDIGAVSGAIHCACWTKDGTRLVVAVGSALHSFVWSEVHKSLLPCAFCPMFDVGGRVCAIQPTGESQVAVATELPLDKLCALNAGVAFEMPVRDAPPATNSPHGHRHHEAGGSGSGSDGSEDSSRRSFLESMSSSLASSSSPAGPVDLTQLLSRHRRSDPSPLLHLQRRDAVVTGAGQDSSHLILITYERKVTTCRRVSVPGILVPDIVAFDPRGSTVAVASNACGMVLVYCVTASAAVPSVQQISLQRGERPKGACFLSDRLLLLMVGRQRNAGDAAFLPSSSSSSSSNTDKYVLRIVAQELMIGGSIGSGDLLAPPSLSSPSTLPLHHHHRPESPALPLRPASPALPLHHLRPESPAHLLHHRPESSSLPLPLHHRPESLAPLLQQHQPHHEGTRRHSDHMPRDERCLGLGLKDLVLPGGGTVGAAAAGGPRSPGGGRRKLVEEVMVVAAQTEEPSGLVTGQAGFSATSSSCSSITTENSDVVDHQHNVGRMPANATATTGLSVTFDLASRDSSRTASPAPHLDKPLPSSKVPPAAPPVLDKAAMGAGQTAGAGPVATVGRAATGTVGPEAGPTGAGLAAAGQAFGVGPAATGQAVGAGPVREHGLEQQQQQQLVDNMERLLSRFSAVQQCVAEIRDYAQNGRKVAIAAAPTPYPSALEPPYINVTCQRQLSQNVFIDERRPVLLCEGKLRLSVLHDLFDLATVEIMHGPLWIVLVADAGGFVPLTFRHRDEVTVRNARRKSPLLTPVGPETHRPPAPPPPSPPAPSPPDLAPSPRAPPPSTHTPATCPSASAPRTPALAPSPPAPGPPDLAPSPRAPPPCTHTPVTCPSASRTPALAPSPPALSPNPPTLAPSPPAPPPSLPAPAPSPRALAPSPPAPVPSPPALAHSPSALAHSPPTPSPSLPALAPSPHTPAPAPSPPALSPSPPALGPSPPAPAPSTHSPPPSPPALAPNPPALAPSPHTPAPTAPDPSPSTAALISDPSSPPDQTANPAATATEASA